MKSSSSTHWNPPVGTYRKGSQIQSSQTNNPYHKYMMTQSTRTQASRKTNRTNIFLLFPTSITLFLRLSPTDPTTTTETVAVLCPLLSSTVSIAGSALKPTASPWYGMPPEVGAPCCPFPSAIATAKTTSSSGARSSNASNTNTRATANASYVSVSNSSKRESSGFISSSSEDKLPRGRFLVQFGLLSLGSLLIASGASTATVTRLLYL